MSRVTPEGRFKDELVADLQRLFPGCHILWNNAGLQTGIPDMLILWQNKWAMLEPKRSATAAHQPNQDWFIDRFNDMSFAAFVFPENKEEVLDDLQRAFRSRRPTRVS
jgi:hypothetical protein